MNDKISIIGDVIVDLVSTEAEVPLRDCETFRRQVGGSCANVARFLTAQDVPCRFLTGLGQDGLGDFLAQRLEQVGVDLSDVQRFADKPTTVVIVSKTSGTPEFVAYLGAHACLERSHVPADFLAKTAVLHTNGISICREPTRSTILSLVEEAHAAGVSVSFDPNWRESLWADREAAMAAIKAISSRATWMKPSLDDAEALFGAGEPLTLAKRYLDWGAKTVVLTMGRKGALVVDDAGHTLVEPKGTLKCATGAGDAFWSIFLRHSMAGATAVEAARHAATDIVELLEGQTFS